MAKTKGFYKRKPIAELEDLRDDCIGIVLDSNMTFKQVHEKGGPTPQTIGKWLYRETRFPQLATIRAMLNACDHDLTITPKGEATVRRFSHEGINYPRPKRAKVATKGFTGKARASANARSKAIPDKAIRNSVKRSKYAKTTETG